MQQRTIIKPIRFINNNKEDNNIIDNPRKEVAHFSLDLKFMKIDLSFFNNKK